MTPERWHEIETIYHAACELPDGERAAFLQQACGADASLQREVDALLRHGATPRSVLDTPAIDVMAKTLADAEHRLDTELLAGATISHYRVLESIGRGGMGIVYKAEDLKLGRHVALKLLPDYLVQDRQALERFEREARAASALNHPNICTVYEIDEAGGRPFIAIEFLLGETLKERMTRGRLTMDELIRIAIEVCDGLQAAHTGGIVHRDIKPANIMLTRQGAVKILDFGAAKLSGQDPAGESPNPAVATDSSQSDLELTVPSAALGTAAYMSPEQASAEVVDTRSDIFSLGVLLYEMTTGQLPFTTARGPDLVVAIRALTPVPVATLNSQAPAGLGRIVAKTLQKDRARRYQDVASLRAELQSLQRRFHGAARRRRITLGAASLIVALAALSVAAMHDVGIQSLITRIITGASDSRPVLQIRSLAVLPFLNLAGDAAQDYLVDGMSNALADDMAKLGLLRVISSSSSMQYKGSRKSLAQIARELDASALVTGTVQRTGNHVRVNAQLVDPSQNRTLWGAAYERDIQDVLKLQHDVATAVAYHVTDKMSPELQTRLAATPQAVNADAYEAYLRGNYFYDKEDAGGFEKASKYYRMAIELDRGFAPAYVGLAQSYAFQAYTNRLPPSEAYGQAEQLLAEGLKLDPNSAPAHVQVGMIKLLYRCDLAGGEREINRALALDPGDIGALDYHSYYLLEMGRTDAAIAEKRVVLASDPVSVGTNAQLGLYLLRAGRNAEAIVQLHRTLELDANNGPALTRLGLAYANIGRYALAVTHLKRAVALEPFPPALGALGDVYARWGKRQEAIQVIRELQEMAPHRFVPAPLIAQIYARLGENEAALRWLAKAKPGDRPTVADPAFDSLRADPRFIAYAARLAPAGACPTFL